MKKRNTADRDSWSAVPASTRKRLREEIFKRDGYECQIRGPRCNGRAEHLDHITPRYLGGALLDPGNLRASCRPCNGAGDSPETAAPSRVW